MNIRIGRTIFAVLVALSVATLPAAVGFAAGGKTMGASASETTPDCDHRHHNNPPNNKTQKTGDDGACLAACAVACFGFVTADFPSIAFLLPMSTAPKFIRASDNVPSRMGSLPFRPPRA
jgi:hypothetical protein